MFGDHESDKIKRNGVATMVPVVETLEKECFIYRYFFIYLNLLYRD